MEQRAVMAEPIVDDRVIEACQSGDREAFRLLFECYKDRVFSIAVYSFGGDQAAASDVSQQIFLKLMTKMAGYNRCVWINVGITKTRGLGTFVESAIQHFANRGSPNSLRRIS